MINGAHMVFFSSDPEADRAFLAEVLSLPHVDVGGGWLIFGLPASEVAVHPAEKSGKHEIYFMCESIEAFMAEMKTRDIPCSDIEDMGWGRLSAVTLPGGGEVGVYEPRHGRPENP